MKINVFPIFVVALIVIVTSLAILGIKTAIQNEQKILNSKKYNPDDDVVIRLTGVKAVIIDYRIINGKIEYNIKYVDPKTNEIEEDRVYESELKLLNK